MAEPQTSGIPASRARANLWVRRVLAGSFLFFLVKGLAWLGVVAFAAYKLS